MSDNIGKIDKNLAFSEALQKRFPDIVLYDAHDCAAEISGLYHKGEDGVFCRLPEEMLPKMSDGIRQLAYHTAGGKVRFRTNSPYVAVKVELRSGFYMRHMPLSGSSGCDIYEGRGEKSRFVKMASPNTVQDLFYEDGDLLLPIAEGELRDITVTMPLYNGIKAIYIGIKAGCVLEAPTPYENGRVVFYGSSITQGGCACRSGNSYDGILSRKYDFDNFNLGFSGSARGEEEIAEYIASLSPTVFVYDYDHNAPTAEHLEATHGKFFDVFRKRCPATPVIFMSRPLIHFHGKEEGERRREIIRSTYERALEAGDRNVYFIDGDKMFPEELRENCTVDKSHPNDLGFTYMAKAVEIPLRKALKL